MDLVGRRGGMGFLPGGSFSRANGVNCDGGVIVGISNAQGALEYEAFVWTAATGMFGLGTLPGASRSQAYGVSLDGSVLVGMSDIPGGTKQAFR